MPMQFVCSACLEAGVRRELAQTDDFLVACSFCGAVDEKATYSRNAVEVSGAFGTLMDEDALNDAKFRKLREKKHDDFIDTLLDVYLVDPTSRIVERHAGHFKAATRSWYNRMRTHEEFTRNLKHTTTNVNAKKVKYRLVVAIHFAIQESNIIVANNKLSRVKASETMKAAYRGDGSIMAPSLPFIFARVQALNPHHVGYLDSWSTLRRTYHFYSKALMRKTPLVDVVMAQVVVLCHRIEHMCRLPWHLRVGHMAAHELKSSAQRKGKELETAEVDDFVLDSESWEFMAGVDWQRVMELAYNLYRAQQVVFLWRNRKSVDIAATLVIWAVQAYKQSQTPGTSSWAKELCLPYGGNDNACLRRRAELRDMLVGWSTSFQAAGLPMPSVQPPAKGGVGDGLHGWSSDKRRAIPEGVMATAAAPVVADNWRLLAQTRLATRSWALPLDVEYTMAAKAFARAYYEQNPEKRRSRFSSRATSRATSRAPSYSPGPGSRQSSAPPVERTGRVDAPRGLKTREDMLRRMNIAPTPPPPRRSPTIEEMLATREDSSDDGEVESGAQEPREPLGGTATDPWAPRAAQSEKPFGFSIGPDGFAVSEGAAADATAVKSQRKRRIPADGAHIAKRVRSNEPTVVPPSPPITSPSSTRLSPTPSLRTRDSASPYPSTSPSLRAISMSPALTTTSLPESVGQLIPIDEEESTRYIGLLLRERDQYVTYNPTDERRRGMVVAPEIEAAMLAWVDNAKTSGIMPKVVTRAYLASLRIFGDPHRQDLGWFIRDHAHEWSPTECLLRLGIRPDEFPPHLVVHSLSGLMEQLYGSFDRLAPIGAAVDADQLDNELDLLFEYGDEKLSDVLATSEEAARKERLYRAQGIWQQPSGVAEGRDGRPLADTRRRHTSAVKAEVGDGTFNSVPSGSKRINYDAIRRLCAPDRDDDDDEDVGGAMDEVFDETLRDVVGDRDEEEEEDIDL